MKKQLIRGFLALNVFAMLAVSAVYAQSVGIEGKIPFQFVVGKTTLPAGEYTIKALTASVLSIQNTDSDERTIVLPMRAERRSTLDKPKLVFHRYGTEYFLAQIWPSGTYAGYELPKTRREQELAKRGSTSEMAYVIANQK